MTHKKRVGTIGSYRKFHFPSVEAAEDAKRIMQLEFPQDIFNVSSAGSLFYRENGSLIYTMKVAMRVHSLGGADP